MGSKQYRNDVESIFNRIDVVSTIPFSMSTGSWRSGVSLQTLAEHLKPISPVIFSNLPVTIFQKKRGNGWNPYENISRMKRPHGSKEQNSRW